MRSAWYLLMVLVILVAGLGVARPISALSCIPLPAIVAKMDLIVRGRITAIGSGTLDLDVSAYYKGEAGPGRLRGQVLGLGQGHRMDWSEIPRVGQELIIGFVRSGDGWENNICHLFVPVQPGADLPEELRALLGAGQPAPAGSEPGGTHSPADSAPRVSPAAGRVGLSLAFGAALVAFLSLLFVWGRRRRR